MAPLAMTPKIAVSLCSLLAINGVPTDADDGAVCAAAEAAEAGDILLLQTMVSGMPADGIPEEESRMAKEQAVGRTRIGMVGGQRFQMGGRYVLEGATEMDGPFYTNGHAGQMGASTAGDICQEDSYTPSEAESSWKAHANEWTATREELCSHLDFRKEWLSQISSSSPSQTGPVFSRLCKRGKAPQTLEPLAGLLRSPRHMCDDPHFHLMDVDFLVLADAASLQLQPGARRFFFDAGGSNFADALQWFTSSYGARGLEFDRIWVWEAVPRGTEQYWAGTSAEERAKWEPRVVFYDGVPVSADPADRANNVVQRIQQECREEDFCAWKLDIDHPPTELPLVQQLLESKKTLALLDEFFFEHHVHGLMQKWWGGNVNGTFADSYAIFTQLRSFGVRAHSWI